MKVTCIWSHTMGGELGVNEREYGGAKCFLKSKKFKLSLVITPQTFNGQRRVL